MDGLSNIVTINGVEYKLFDSVSEMHTRKMLCIYEELDKIITDETLDAVKNKNLDETIKVLEATMYTHSRIRICANLIASTRSENELSEIVGLARKEDTDMMINFFFRFFFEPMIMERVTMRMSMTILSTNQR